jgi:hypothetical protein
MEQQSIKLLKAQVADLQKQIKLLQNQERQNKRQLLKVRKQQKQILKIQDETYKAIVQLFTQNTPKKYKHAPRKGKSLFKPTKNAILAVRRKK